MEEIVVEARKKVIGYLFSGVGKKYAKILVRQEEYEVPHRNYFLYEQELCRLIRV
jgi:hypothetical protein